MKKTCTVIAIALAMALLVSLAVLSTGAESKPSLWDGKTVSTELKTDTDGAYLIQSAADLAYFAKSVNEGGNYYVGKTVKLTTDIAWNEGNCFTWTKDTTGLNPWSPIGPWNKHFQGIFDGQGHTVSGLHCVGTGNLGFFGVLWGGQTTVKNLVVANSAFFSTGSNVGGIAGVVRGNVTTIENCIFGGSVEGAAQVGGIVGALWNNENGNLTVNNCAVEGTVKSTGQYGGGIVGMQGAGANTLTITNCLNLANVTAQSYAGGINGGFNWSARGQKLTVTDCVSVGTVADIRTDADTDGAIFGNHADNPTLKDLLFATDGEQGFGGNIPTKDGATGKTSAEIFAMYTSDLAAAGLENWIYVGNVILPKAIADILGVKEVLPPAPFEGDVWDGKTVSTELKTDTDGAYLIQSAADLAFFAKSVKDGTTYDGKTVKLTTDIRWNDIEDFDSWTKDTTGLNPWTAIGYPDKPFKGTFDGQGHTLSGIWGKGTHWRYGIFSRVTNATIKNLVVDNSALFAVSGNPQQSGGLIGAVVGGSVTVENCYIDVDFSMVQAQWYAGGVIGCLVDNGCVATIKNTVYAGNVNSTSAYAGGFIGSIRHGAKVQISDSLMIGSVTSTLANSWAGGFVGGTAAETTSVTITDSMVLGTVVGKDDFGAVVSNRNKASCTMASTNLWVLDIASEGTGSFTGEVKKTVAEISVLDTEALAAAGFESWGLTDEGVMPKAIAKLRGLEVIGDKDDSTDTSTDSNTSSGSDTSDTDTDSDTGSTDTSTDTTVDLPKNPVVKPDLSKASSYNGTKSTKLRTEGSTVYIDSAADLAYFADTVTNGTPYVGKTVVLTTDIVWNNGDADTWTATSTGLNPWVCGAWNKFFRGTFDGQGHTISGLYQVSAKDNIGFINGVGGTCEIKNLVLVNSAFFCTRDGGSANLGAVVGVMGEATKLTIDNVYADVNCSAPKAIQVGGIVGRVHNGLCTLDITNTVFAGTVEGSSMVGGIIGNVEVNNNSAGTSTSVKISDTLMIGTVKGNSKTAGVVGRNENGETILTNVIVAGVVTSDKNAAFLGEGKVNATLSNCYYAEEVAKVASAVGDCTGFTALKASELTGKATITGWTALGGTYPMPSSVASLVKLAGNSDTSDFSAVTATVLASVALMSAAVVLLAKKNA